MPLLPAVTPGARGRAAAPRWKPHHLLYGCGVLATIAVTGWYYAAMTVGMGPNPDAPHTPSGAPLWPADLFAQPNVRNAFMELPYPPIADDELRACLEEIQWLPELRTPVINTTQMVNKAHLPTMRNVYWGVVYSFDPLYFPLPLRYFACYLPDEAQQVMGWRVLGMMTRPHDLAALGPSHVKSPDEIDKELMDQSVSYRHHAYLDLARMAPRAPETIGLLLGCINETVGRRHTHTAGIMANHVEVEDAFKACCLAMRVYGPAAIPALQQALERPDMRTIVGKLNIDSGRAFKPLLPRLLQGLREAITADALDVREISVMLNPLQEIGSAALAGLPDGLQTIFATATRLLQTAAGPYHDSALMKCLRLLAHAGFAAEPFAAQVAGWLDLPDLQGSSTYFQGDCVKGGIRERIIGLVTEIMQPLSDNETRWFAISTWSTFPAHHIGITRTTTTQGEAVFSFVLSGGQTSLCETGRINLARSPGHSHPAYKDEALEGYGCTA